MLKNWHVFGLPEDGGWRRLYADCALHAAAHFSISKEATVYILTPMYVLSPLQFQGALIAAFCGHASSKYPFGVLMDGAAKMTETKERTITDHIITYIYAISE